MPDWVVKDRKDYAAFFLNLSRTGGEVVAFRSAGRPAFLVNCPEHAERVLSLNESNYKNPYHPYRELSAHYEITGSALLQLKRGDGAKALEQTTSELTRAALNISADLQALSSTEPVNLMTSLKKWVFCAVARLLFGVDAQHLSGAFVEASHFAEECWANGLFTQPNSSPSEMEKHYHAAVQTQERTAAWIAEEACIGSQDQSVKQAIVRTLLNGYNATATTLCWVIYVILRHREVRAKVYAEIDASLNNTNVKKSDNFLLPYLRMVVKETLRLYPPAWILGREALDKDWLGSTFIPKGSRVLVSPYTMQRHSQLWENPGQFNPGRFNSHSSIKPFTYFPFGGGERKCPASRFVLSHLHVLISVLLDSSHIEIASTEPIRPRGLIALHPQPNVLVLATPRKSKFSLMV